MVWKNAIKTKKLKPGKTKMVTIGLKTLMVGILVLPGLSFFVLIAFFHTISLTSPSNVCHATVKVEHLACEIVGCGG